MTTDAKNTISGPALNWYSNRKTEWNTFVCWVMGHSMPPWKYPHRKRDARYCVRCGVFGEWREGYLTNDEYHNTENTKVRP